jgi:hypothetical protein
MIVNKLSFSCCWLDGMRPFLLVFFFKSRGKQTREKKALYGVLQTCKKTNGKISVIKLQNKSRHPIEWNESKRFWTDWNRRRWWYKRGGGERYASLLFHWTKYHLISRFTSIRMREEARERDITTTTGDEQQTGGCVSWSNTTESWLKQRDT